MTNETEYNHARSELAKLDPNADSYSVQLRGRVSGSPDGGKTHWMLLTPEQYAQVKALLISFNL